jgi:nucleotide-binding universal stress UspA family protein
MPRIVVGTCRHPHVDEALRYAADLAARVVGEVVAVHVRTSPPLHSAVYYDLSSVAGDLTDVGEARAFDRARAALSGRVPAWRFVTEHGPVAEGIAAAADRVAATLVVLGDAGRWSLGGWLGSPVADTLIGWALPVVVVPNAPAHPVQLPTGA